MIKIKETTSQRVYCNWEKDGIFDISVEGYILENGVTVLDNFGKWTDYNHNEYAPVKQGEEIIGFNLSSITNCD